MAANGASAATTPGPPPWPDDSLSYAALPATGDDGFPQAFLLALQGTVYRVTMGVTYFDPDLVLGVSYANTIFDLPDPTLGLYLNLKLEYENLPDPSRLIGAQRVVLDMPIAMGPLRFRFSRVRVAQANLQGAGSYGSELLAQVAVANV
jgi:hypothetical protein